MLFVKDENLTCEAAAINTNVHFIWVLELHVTFCYVSAPGLLGKGVAVVIAEEFQMFNIMPTQTKTKL